MIKEKIIIALSLLFWLQVTVLAVLGIMWIGRSLKNQASAPDQVTPAMIRNKI